MKIYGANPPSVITQPYVEMMLALAEAPAELYFEFPPAKVTPLCKGNAAHPFNRLS